jgi:hypothetical protein
MLRRKAAKVAALLMTNQSIIALRRQDKMHLALIATGYDAVILF